MAETGNRSGEETGSAAPGGYVVSPELLSGLDETAALRLTGDVGEDGWTLVGRSSRMCELVRQVALMSTSDAAVLIQGETGSGKELVARLLHHLSPRCGHPFVPVNAASLREKLFESELFGHLRGSFTGAVADHVGLASSADGGTLFLDEIGELCADSQSKLLRFLDRREVRPVGSTETRRVDVRLICATNRHLEHEVQRGGFRRDLYYRLRVLSLRVPSLRERPEDVALLIQHFAAHHGRKIGRALGEIEPAVLERLAGHAWPGNVRELSNEVKRWVVLAGGGPVTMDLLSAQIRSAPAGDEPAAGLKQRSREQVRQMLLTALERNEWNVSATARQLDISRVGLTKKMRRLGIERPRRRRRRG